MKRPIPVHAPGLRGRVPPPAVAGPSRLASAALALMAAGCASTPSEPLPDAIRNPPPGNLQLVEVRQHPDRHIGAPVRWGGTVVEVRRDAQGGAEIEVLERRLDGIGRPRPGSPSDGRFLIRARRDVDESLYRLDSDVTVTGTVRAAVTTRDRDRGDVVLPVVGVTHFVRWQPSWRGYPYEYYPYYYDPWYWHDPWYWPRWRFGLGYSYGHRHPYYRFGYRHFPYWW